MKSKYEGTCYIGVVGPEADYGVCRDSIHNIARRPGDAAPHWIRATKGFEARQLHLTNWISNTHHDFALFLDADMVFPPDVLERLRSHRLPYVSGLYMRRQYSPVSPVWFRPFEGEQPFPPKPWVGRIEPDRLHAIGASGWGCILMHREVVQQTRPLLKGEAEILEDDMDIWPYDLGRVFHAVNGIKELVDTQPPARTLRAALAVHTATLAEELRPLRGIKSNMGSDIRFPYYALQAGYQLMGDPAADCGHMLNYPLTPTDYAHVPEDVITQTAGQTEKDVQAEADRIAAAREALS